MCEIDRTQHLGLGQLVSFRFHHHHRVLGARDHEVEALVGVVTQHLHVVAGRVQHILAVLEAHAGPRDRAHERRTRDRQRSRSGDHRDDVGVIHEVMATARCRSPELRS